MSSIDVALESSKSNLLLALQQWSISQLLAKRKPELQRFCQERQLATTGTKAVLVDRLIEWKNHTQTAYSKVDGNKKNEDEASIKDDSDEDEDEDNNAKCGMRFLESGIGTMRLTDVSKKKEAVWEQRQHKDIYTLEGRSAYDDNPNVVVQVDHVWEIQLLNRVATVVDAKLPFQRVTRAQAALAQPKVDLERIRLKEVRKIVNEKVNLNNTSSTINQAKKGPFTKFVHRLQSEASRGTVKSVFGLGESRPTNLTRLEWENIEKALIECQSGIDDEIEALGPENSKCLTIFQEELNNLSNQLGIRD